jgi:hypothetical protein
LEKGENDELADSVEICIQRWRNAGPEARKKMFSLFAVAGIFLVVCRHGHVLFICDMIRSGELWVHYFPDSIFFTVTISRMKYPFAIVNKLIDIYGTDLGLGYDIMCGFTKSLQKSSLGPKALQSRLHGIVPAFHGHAHNRGCQVHWHPMYMEDAGIEDFEECERTFSRSNELASGTRLATPFHRHQQIDEHFAFHDEDKFAESGTYYYLSSLTFLLIPKQELSFFGITNKHSGSFTTKASN